MTKGEKKFNELKDSYVKNYKRRNNKNVVVKYKDGFVYIKGENDYSESKVRISHFEVMTERMEKSPDYVAPKESVKFVLEQKINDTDVDIEDGGEAKITDVSVHKNKKRNDADEGIFVRLISNCPNAKHKDFNKLVDRKVRITIETID